DTGQIQETLEGHILHPVLFKDEVENIYAQGGYFFIEFGPKNILTGLVNNTLADKPHFAVALNPAANQDSDRQLREAYVQLKVAGLQIGVFDPYPLIQKIQVKKKSPVTVTLNGGLYITEKTRSAFEKALLDGEKLSILSGIPTPSVGINSNGKAEKTAQPAPVPPAVPAPAAPPAAAAAPTSVPAPVPGLLAQNLAQIQAMQNETLRVHEQYLNAQSEYARTFSQLLQMGFSGQKDGSAQESLERSLGKFHEHQQATLKVHEQYLQTQASFTQNLFALIQQVPVGVLAAFAAPQIAVNPAPAVVPASPAPTPAAVAPAIMPAPVLPSANPVVKPAAQAARTAPAVSAVPAVKTGGSTLETISAGLFRIVSEKTGYPVEMLDANMDMEADLGIDSIKKVEILGAMQSQFPELPKPEAEALAELRTLAQIVSFMGASAATAGVIAAPAKLEGPAAALQPTPAVQTAVASPVSGDLKKAVLEIVSEKTGYPAEMIEPGMDMEADLGIDSIKKVEILGAVQSAFPDLPRPEPEVLSELRTLGQVIDYYQSKSAPAAAPEPLPAIPSPTASVAPAAANPAAASGSVD
ncbi:MAG TPA: phosphopantetheine-binding protein, partial [Anaerolineaceae bacterium]